MGFADLAGARQWAADFVHWYNHEHRHSGIRYVAREIFGHLCAAPQRVSPPYGAA